MEKVIRKFIRDNIKNHKRLLLGSMIFNLSMEDFLYCYYPRDRYLIETEIAWWGDKRYYYVNDYRYNEIVLDLRPKLGRSVTTLSINKNRFGEVSHSEIYFNLD